jgi:solute carrier family 35
LNQTIYLFEPSTSYQSFLVPSLDTFIVFRSAVPILVAVGETLFLRQPWSSIKTWLSLAVIFDGGLIYVFSDYQFTLKAYGWAFAYLVSMFIDFVYQQLGLIRGVWFCTIIWRL